MLRLVYCVFHRFSLIVLRSAIVVGVVVALHVVVAVSASVVAVVSVGPVVVAVLAVVVGGCCGYKSEEEESFEKNTHG